MKDAIHHLKHVQKKVIQSVRKVEVPEEKKTDKINGSLVSEGELPISVKKKTNNSQLRKSFIRVNVH